MNMTNAPSSSNQNSPRGSHDISHSLSERSIPFESRDVRIGGRGVNLVNILFHCDFSIGNQILKYLSSRDIKALRESCATIASMLLEKGFFNSKVASTDLESVLPEEMPASVGKPSANRVARKLVVIIVSDNELFNQVMKADNDPESQESILSKLPNINIKDKIGVTLLHYACIKGDEGLVKILIEKFKAKIDESNLDKQTGLHLAISNGQIGIAKYLLSHGANILSKSSTGQNGLHYAVHYGEKEFIQWLFELCLDDNQKQQLIISQDNDGKSAMHYAGLHPARDLVRLLHQKGVKIDEANNYNYTPLHLAAVRNESLEVIAELIEIGADIDAITFNGDNPLMLAIRFNNWKVAEYLGKIELGH